MVVGDDVVNDWVGSEVDDRVRESLDEVMVV